MKKNIVIFFLFLSLFASAQREASNWYFGDGAGISFNINREVTAVNDGQLNTVEGCTSISNANGELLFYTDGKQVFNANHAIMSNGNALRGDESSTQSAIIIPKPQDPNIYYIFTVASSQNATGLGMFYSEVNMTLDSGLGAITSNKNILLLTACSEKLAAVLKDCDTQSIWVLALSNFDGSDTFGMNTFHAFEISTLGVSNTAITSQIAVNINDPRGYLKIAPDGSKIATANTRDGLFIADFNKLTGIVSNPKKLSINNNLYPYGVEFSPNNQLLYVSSSNDFFNQQNPSENEISSNHNTSLVQFNLNAANIQDSQFVIDERESFRGSLQLGPNGKIYRSMSITYNLGAPFLSLINNPNELGIRCNYQNNAIQLTANSRQGLPPFISSFFAEDIDIIPTDNTNTINLPLCTGDTYSLVAEVISDATYTWTKDAVSIPTPATPNILFINENGNYEVLIELNNGNCETKKGQAIVTYYDIPTATKPEDIILCDVNNDGVFDFDFSIQTATILGTQSNLNFEVNYYKSENDATTNTDKITALYQNTSNPQTIFARAQNYGNPNCFAITSFDIFVFNTPIIENKVSFTTCDLDANPMDGLTEINLTNFNALVLGNQDITKYNITYHASIADANSGQNNLPSNYTNQTPINDIIFVRIENNRNPTCYSTDSIMLTVNPIPDAFFTSIYQCDDRDSVNGSTIFNLTEIDETITGNSTNTSIEYYISEANALNNSNPLDKNAYQNTSNPQTIYTRVTNTTSGCFNTNTVNLEVSNTQINNYIAPEVCDELNSEDGINTFNLNDFSTDILFGLPDGLDINYYESYNDALLEQNPLASSYNNTTPYSQTIFVRLENANACFGINEVLLKINKLPNVESNEAILYCLNTFPETIRLESVANESDSNTYTYLWSLMGETTSSIDINTSGEYTVTVTNTLTGCEKTKTISVEGSNVATIDSVNIIDGGISNNQISVITSGEGDYEYALTNQNNITTAFQSSPIFTQIAPGIYNVIVRDKKNNCGSIEKLVSVIGFPKYFTPNNDAINDTWQVYGVSEQFQPNSTIHIFDRFGKLLKTLSPLGKGWNGTFNGVLMPANDYWFSVTLDDGRTYKNHFTLKR